MTASATALMGIPLPGRLCESGLPGYTGYVPGKVSENIHGGRFYVENKRATSEVDVIRSGVRYPPPFREPAPTQGHEVPGYAGFVPGRYADNIMGLTVARGGENAWMAKNEQREERLHKTASFRQGERPPTGTADYAGYRTAISLPGVATDWTS